MISVGNFCIMGNWDSTPEPEGKVCIRIAPNNVFGIGNHVSTKAFLRALEDVPPRGSVLDVGSGSGILSIAALKLGATWVDCVDVAMDAGPAVQRNMEASGISQGFAVIRGDASKLETLKPRYDLVMMNIDDTDLILGVARWVAFDSMLVMPETQYVDYLKATLESAGLEVSLVEEALLWTLIRIGESS